MNLRKLVQILTILSVCFFLIHYFFEQYVPIYFSIATYFIFTITFFLVLYLMKTRSSGEMPKNKDDDEIDDVFHNDFSKVPHATEDLRPPKPINFLGNIYENLDEAFKEDMERIGIDVDKTRKGSKKK